MKRINYLFGAMVLAASLPALSAQAAPILLGNSNGSTFSGLGCAATCPNTSLTSTILTIGSTAPGGSNSVLSIVNTSFSASGNLTGLQLAEVSLLVGQKPGEGQSGITFNYNLVLTFSTPFDSESQTFNLAGSGDGGAGANADVVISGLALSLTDPLVLSGVTLSNFRFSTVAGDTNSVFANGSWDGSAQGTTHLLYLLADVTGTGEINPTADEIPEPLTLSLFGAGFAGAVAIRRRRKSSKA